MNTLSVKKYALFVLIFLFALFCAFGCSRENSVPNRDANNPVLYIDSISISPSIATLEAGYLKQFEIIEYCKNEFVSQNSYNNVWKVIGNVGTIDATGLFTATREGTGEIEVISGGLKAKNSVYVTSDLLTEVFERVDNYFLYPDRIPDNLKSLNSTELKTALSNKYGSSTSFLQSLEDPYTRWVSYEKDNINSIVNSSSFGGTGIMLGKRKNKMGIEYVFPGLPAEKAGLKSGDEIVEVDGININGATIDEVVSLIRGTEGVPVRLKISRADSTLIFDVVRKRYTPKNASGKILANNIGYIQLFQFGSSASYDFQEAYNNISSGLNGLILDLRLNSGGLLYQALDVADMFIPDAKPIVHYRDRYNFVEPIYSSSDPKIGLPLIVLMDSSTASGAEILASALIENCNAISVGEKTYGKGTIQGYRSLSDYSSLYITIAEFLSPTRQTIDGKGINPAYVVYMTDEDFFLGNDTQLKAAIEKLKNKGLMKAQSVRSLIYKTNRLNSVPDYLKEIEDFTAKSNVKFM